MENRPLEYDYSVSKLFVYTALGIGFVGMLVGVIIAWQMAFPAINTIFGDGAIAEYTNFSRLRVLHTDSVIYGFVLSGVWATWYYVGQRVLKVSMAESKTLMVIGYTHFWIYLFAAIVLVISLLMGITQSKEYAEFE